MEEADPVTKAKAMTPEQRTTVVEAIQLHQKLQLGYRRTDGSLSLHTVAPVDIQPGDRPSTSEKEYLWAFCYAENKAELHLCERILSARILDERFSVNELLDMWPREWTLPEVWRVPRSWASVDEGEQA